MALTVWLLKPLVLGDRSITESLIPKMLKARKAISCKDSSVLHVVRPLEFPPLYLRGIIFSLPLVLDQRLSLSTIKGQIYVCCNLFWRPMVSHSLRPFVGGFSHVASTVHFPVIPCILNLFSMCPRNHCLIPLETFLSLLSPTTQCVEAQDFLIA